MSITHSYARSHAHCWRKIQSLHVDVEGKGVGAVKEVVAGVEVDQEQDADQENLQSEGDVADEEMEGEVDEEGHLVDNEESPDHSACQKLWHFHPQPGPSFE